MQCQESWSVFWVQLLLEWVTANPKDQCHGGIWSPLILIRVEGPRWTVNLYNGLMLMFISICTCTGLVRVDTFGRGSCGNVIKALRLGKTVYVCVHLRKSNRSFQHICAQLPKRVKTEKNWPGLRLVPIFVKLPHESPQKNWKSGHEGFLRNLHFCFFPL